jgi:hypothetical protein
MVNSGLEIIFNDFFDSHFFGRKRKKSRFFRQEKMKAAAVYQTRIKHSAAEWKRALFLRFLRPSSFSRKALQRLPLRSSERSGAAKFEGLE